MARAYFPLKWTGQIGCIISAKSSIQGPLDPIRNASQWYDQVFEEG